ncbi:CrcB protein [Methylobacterium sp. 4-46]|uniref:Fluoride-specific ion channel FluC n=1 Tax=Methylobacterium sp. (strain 4-46) TaxID=426117 RepID=FLUC_METS4|nr:MULTISPECIES: fluoride efflux transporter CrcB [Methylobacterium]B0UQ37.1 RecName: Full=Fluoride-specific ion channel FluC [Methylobacterium sp. 4-46]ACA16168.1 CrcB protein [Methylobacterium sp. 4-46]WFT81877.1 fluoride efflux transporter CrcB [Methylobacterium nodulans]
MLNTLVVFLGAGLGGALRYGVNVSAARLGGSFPAATMIINVSGSLAMGILAGWFVVRAGLPQSLRLFLTTGILGGFTTFSTFSLEAFLLIERGALAQAVLYVIGSVAAGIAGVAVSFAIIRHFG